MVALLVGRSGLIFAMLVVTGSLCLCSLLRMERLQFACWCCESLTWAFSWNCGSSVQRIVNPCSLSLWWSSPASDSKPLRTISPRLHRDFPLCVSWLGWDLANSVHVTRVVFLLLKLTHVWFGLGGCGFSFRWVVLSLSVVLLQPALLLPHLFLAPVCISGTPGPTPACPLLCCLLCQSPPTRSVLWGPCLTSSERSLDQPSALLSLCLFCVCPS